MEVMPRTPTYRGKQQAHAHAHAACSPQKHVTQPQLNKLEINQFEIQKTRIGLKLTY